MENQDTRACYLCGQPGLHFCLVHDRMSKNAEKRQALWEESFRNKLIMASSAASAAEFADATVTEWEKRFGVRSSGFPK